MKISNPYYLIIDLEATCCDNNEFPRHEMEIIEIGAVILDAETLELESEFQTFIKPTLHKTLTAFCTELTSITQNQVDDAPEYKAAMQLLGEWLEKFPDALFCSWGDYDRKQFLRECERKNVEYPFHSGHLNLKESFRTTLELKKRFGLAGALKYLKLEFDGTHHRGIDDARNIARVVQAVMRNQ